MTLIEKLIERVDRASHRQSKFLSSEKLPSLRKHYHSPILKKEDTKENTLSKENSVIIEYKGIPITFITSDKETFNKLLELKLELESGYREFMKNILPKNKYASFEPTRESYFFHKTIQNKVGEKNKISSIIFPLQFKDGTITFKVNHLEALEKILYSFEDPWSSHTQDALRINHPKSCERFVKDLIEDFKSLYSKGQMEKCDLEYSIEKFPLIMRFKDAFVRFTTLDDITRNVTQELFGRRNLCSEYTLEQYFNTMSKCFGEDALKFLVIRIPLMFKNNQIVKYETTDLATYKEIINLYNKYCLDENGNPIISQEKFNNKIYSIIKITNNSNQNFSAKLRNPVSNNSALKQEEEALHEEVSIAIKTRYADVTFHTKDIKTIKFLQEFKDKLEKVDLYEIIPNFVNPEKISSLDIKINLKFDDKLLTYDTNDYDTYNMIIENYNYLNLTDDRLQCYFDVVGDKIWPLDEFLDLINRYLEVFSDEYTINSYKISLL